MGFPLACSVTNDLHIKDLIWHFVKEEKAENYIFFESCHSNNADGVKYCLDNVKDDKQTEKKMLEWIGRGESYCGLFEVMSRDHKEIVDLLIPLYEKKYPDILKKKCREGNNPLIRAALQGDVGVVKHLIPYYEKENLIGEIQYDDFDPRDQKNLLLMMAKEIENEEICDMLITSFKNLDDPSPLTVLYIRQNALIRAIYHGKTNIARKLIPLYKDKKLLGELGALHRDEMNALMAAACKGNLELFNILLPHFKEENLIHNLSRRGENVLDIAKYSGGSRSQKSESKEIENQLNPYFK